MCGEEEIKHLLDRRGIYVQIIEEVVKAAAGNGFCGEKVIIH